MLSQGITLAVNKLSSTPEKYLTRERQTLYRKGVPLNTTFLSSHCGTDNVIQKASCDHALGNQT